MKPELKGTNVGPPNKMAILIFIQRFKKKHRVKEIREVSLSQNKILKWTGTSENPILGTFVFFLKI